MKQPDRRISTTQFAMDDELHTRLTACRDAKQARVGKIRYVTLNEVLQDWADEYDKTSALMRDLGVKP
jgi:hypothetical protein